LGLVYEYRFTKKRGFWFASGGIRRRPALTGRVEAIP